MNELANKIARLCAANGPMSLADYMHTCLADPELGYYATREAIGVPENMGGTSAGGDFITAPEVSQMFGELIGVWCVDTWHKLGKPARICLAELGPGRGRMMSDMLRAAALDPDFVNALVVHLVETSQKLRKEQAKTLEPVGQKIRWDDRIEDLPEMPVIVVANEFLDAIPFRQFVKQDGQWREIGVMADKTGKFSQVALAASIDERLLPKAAAQEPDGAVFEYAPAREALAEIIATKIKAHGGAALFVDYGHTKSGFGDTFQAVRNHARADPFADPGETDLTSHVDFERIASAMNAASGNKARLTTQGEFLINLGLAQRAGALGAPHPEGIRNRIRLEVERLASPSAMGELFKVLGMASPDIGIAGFQE